MPGDEKNVLPWPVKRIKDIEKDAHGVVQTGPFGAQLHSKDYVAIGIPLLLIRNLKDGKVDFKGLPRVREEDAKRLSMYRVETGDLVFSRVGRVGSSLLITDREAGWLISGQLLRLRPPKQLVPKFAYYALSAADAQKYALDASVGSTRQSINTSILENLRLPLPPLPEQRRIADILDTLDRTIESTQRIIAKLQAARQGLLHDLLTRGLDERGHLRDPEKNPELFKDTVMGRVPRDWEVQSLGETVEIFSGSTPSRALMNRYFGGQVNWVKTLDLNESYLHDTSEKIKAIALDETPCRLFPSGTVLLAMYGGWEQIGRTALLSHPAATNQAISALLADWNTINPAYLMYTLQNNRRSWRKYAASTRKDPNITKTDVEDFEISFPTSIAEQKCIVTLIEAQLSRISAEQAQLAKLQTLKRGLMEDLLTGRKRVSVGESEPGKQAEAEPPANIPFESPRTPAFDPVVNFRASAGADPAAQTDWVAQAREIAARQQVTAYSREALAKAVADLAELSRTLDGILQVPDVLKAAGVRFVLLKHSKGSKTSGAAFWLDAEAKPPTQPVVALSMRYPHIDVFWFNLFHELGHIWHGHAAVMGEELVTYSDPAPAEQEAHAYAREALIPEAIWQPYLQSGNHTMRGILAFAKTVGRHHATVAGRLGNDLKDFPRFNSRDHRPAVPNDLFDRLLLRLGGSL